MGGDVLQASAKFTVSLEDDTSKSAMTASKALAELQAAMKSDMKALAEMQKAMKALQGGTDVDVAAFRRLKEGIDAKKKSIAQAQQKFLDLGGVLGRNYKQTKESAKGFGALRENILKLPGPAGESLRKLDSLGAVLGGVSFRAMAMAAATVALVAGITVATIALAKYAITAQDARRSEELQLEGMTKVRNYYGLAADSASFLQGTIDQVSASSAIGRDQVAAYAKQLYGMGLRAGNLQEALQGVATVASTQGADRANIFASMAAGAAATGQSVKALADDVKARLGGIAAKQMLSLDVQTMKLKENMDALFRGIGIEKFLAGLNSVFQMFSQGTATGRALKVILETIFRPLIDGAAGAGNVVRRVFQGMTIGALILVIGFLKLKKAVAEAFEGSVVSKWMKKLTGGIDGAKVAIVAGVALAGALAIAMSVLAFNTMMAVGPWILLGAVLTAVFVGAYMATTWAIGKIGEALDWMGKKIDKAKEYFSANSWTQIGLDLVNGIVNGIEGGAQWVLDAVKNLGSSAVTAFKETLGIHSPSRVFFEQGQQVGAGAAMGIESSAPSVQAAADSMAPTPSAGGTAGGGGGGSVTIGEIHIHAQSSDPQALAVAFRDQLAQIFEGLSLEMGAPVGGAA